MNRQGRRLDQPNRYQSSKTEPIQNLDPHYTNDRFKQAQTVWLASGSRLIAGDFSQNYVEGASYEYSDRLLQWFDSQKLEAAHQAALLVNQNPATAAYIEAYLQSLYDDQSLKLLHIMSGFNLGNGYPYRVYGFTRGQAEESQST